MSADFIDRMRDAHQRAEEEFEDAQYAADHPAPDLTPAEREIVARFEAAPVLEEAWRPETLTELGEATRAAGWRPMDDPTPAAPGTDHSGAQLGMAAGYREGYHDGYEAALAARRLTTEAEAAVERAARVVIQRAEKFPVPGWVVSTLRDALGAAADGGGQ